MEESVASIRIMDLILGEAISDPLSDGLPYEEADDLPYPARYEFDARLRDAQLWTRRLTSRARWQHGGRGQVERNKSRTEARGGSYSLTKTEWENILLAFRGSCAYCGEVVRFPAIEHVMPVCLGGGTDAYNVVPACQKCNSSKGRRPPWEWMNSEKYAEIKSTLRRANP